jgi:acetoin utilization protein AcuB
MFVRNHMTSPAITVEPELAFPEALRIMREKGFRRLPVVDKKGILVGIVSERDLLYASPSPATTLSMWEVNYLLSKIKVNRLMSTSVVTIKPDDTIEAAAWIMVENKIGGMPVVNEQNRPIGVITETDIFRTLVDMFGAGQSGLRLTLKVPQKQGVLAKMAELIFRLGGNIVSVGTFPIADQPEEAVLVVKVQDVGKSTLIEALEGIGDHVTDAREV